MTTITIKRSVLEQALEALEIATEDYDDSAVGIEIDAIRAIRAELAKPVESITTDMAVKRLCQALRDDLDYAWSWHCNVAMSAYDAGCPHDVANEGAARFMQLLAGVDTREHFAFSGTQTKAEVISPTPAWREACRLFRVRCSPEDIQRMAKLRAYIEDGLLIVSRPDNKPPTPAWHDAPTEPGIWLCDEGGPDCYTCTAHNIVLLNDPALKDDECRWYGPIPQDGAKAEGGAA